MQPLTVALAAVWCCLSNLQSANAIQTNGRTIATQPSNGSSGVDEMPAVLKLDNQKEILLDREREKALPHLLSFQRGRGHIKSSLVGPANANSSRSINPIKTVSWEKPSTIQTSKKRVVLSHAPAQHTAQTQRPIAPWRSSLQFDASPQPQLPTGEVDPMQNSVSVQQLQPHSPSVYVGQPAPTIESHSATAVSTPTDIHYSTCSCAHSTGCNQCSGSGNRCGCRRTRCASCESWIEKARPDISNREHAPGNMSPHYPYDTERFYYYQRPYNSEHVSQRKQQSILSGNGQIESRPYSNWVAKSLNKQGEKNLAAAGSNLVEDGFLEYVDWRDHQSARIQWESHQPNQIQHDARRPQRSNTRRRIR